MFWGLSRKESAVPQRCSLHLVVQQYEHNNVSAVVKPRTSKLHNALSIKVASDNVGWLEMSYSVLILLNCSAIIAFVVQVVTIHPAVMTQDATVNR